MKRRGAALAALVGAGWVLFGEGRLVAGPDSEVASAFDPGDRFDIHASIDYRYASRRSILKREQAGKPGADPDGAMPLVRDLVFAGGRHELVPRVAVGLFTDVALTLELPVVLGDSRTLELDDGVEAGRSTAVADGLLPASGFDAQDGGDGGDAIFRGVNRSGLDQLHVGAVWAPLNQARDRSKPVWKVGAEIRLSIGEVMSFDRSRPEGETGVSRGVHELRLYTSMARRVGWAEPFFELWWMGGLATRDAAPLDGLGREFAADSTSPQGHAGGRFGLEVIAWESPTRRERFGGHLGGEIEALFEGRAYTDLWEVFAYAGEAPFGGVLALDSDPVMPGQQALSHPGVSNVESYMTVAGHIGADAHLIDRVRLDLDVELGWEQSHIISFADAGQDGDDDNDVVDAGTAEVNPLHAPVVDAAGHRYRVDGAATTVVSLGVRVLF